MRAAAGELGRRTKETVEWMRAAIEPALIEKEVSIASFEQLLNEVVAELNKEAIPDLLQRKIMIDRKIMDEGSVRYVFHFVANKDDLNLDTNPYPSGNGDVETFFLLVWMSKSLTSAENFTHTIRKDRAKHRLQTSLQKYLRSTGRPAFGWNS